MKVTKGEEKVTAVFNQKIIAWARNGYRGRLDQLQLETGPLTQIAWKHVSLLESSQFGL